jgi:hypothetical protein
LEASLIDFKIYYKTIVVKQHGTGIKTDTSTNETGQKNPRNNPKHFWLIDF